MAHVTTVEGRDLGEVTGRALDYYRREPGFLIDGVETAQALAADEETAVVETVEVVEEEQPTPRRGRRAPADEPTDS